VKIEVYENKATLFAKPSPRIMIAIQRLEGRRSWLKAGGLSFESSRHNIEIFKEAFGDELGVSYIGGDDIEFDQPPILSEYTLKTKPYPHQRRALIKAKTMPNFALFMEQGTGKTKVAIDRAGDLFHKGLISGVLVVAPKGVHRQWVDEQIPKHYNGEYDADFWPIKELRPELSRGDCLKFLTINIDGIKTVKGKVLVHNFVNNHSGNILMVVDESHQIKNARSQRWTACNEIGNLVRYRMILTGTPIAKDLTDEWAQFKWLKEDIIGIRYASAFRNEYCIMGGFEGRAVVGTRNLDKFKAITEPYIFRATKEEIGILPKAYSPWRFSMSAQQKKLFKDMKKQFIAQIETGEISTAQNAAVAMIRLQQIANGFIVDEDGDMHQIFDDPKKNPRNIALMEASDTIEGKIIIWARFKQDIRTIKALLKDECVTYYGETSDADRKAAVDSFLDKDRARFFVSNPAAGGTGLNLQGLCTNAIYYSNSENSIDRWQSEDRIDRIGSLAQASIETSRPLSTIRSYRIFFPFI